MAGTAIVFTHKLKSKLRKIAINTYTFVIDNVSYIYTKFQTRP
jgi:hypothetical protein